MAILKTKALLIAAFKVLTQPRKVIAWGLLALTVAWIRMIDDRWGNKAADYVFEAMDDLLLEFNLHPIQAPDYQEKQRIADALWLQQQIYEDRKRETEYRNLIANVLQALNAEEAKS